MLACNPGEGKMCRENGVQPKHFSLKISTFLDKERCGSCGVIDKLTLP